MKYLVLIALLFLNCGSRISYAPCYERDCKTAMATFKNSVGMRKTISVDTIVADDGSRVLKIKYKEY
jgi:hypothetical protein